jgi:hypothetical protein
MRKLSLSAALFFFAAAGAAHAAPPAEELEWSESYAVTGSAPRLVVSNVWGTVRVRRGPAGEIGVSVSGRLSAPDERRLERARTLYAIDVAADAGAVEILVGGDDVQRWRHDPCRGCRAEYRFDIVVPEDAEIDVGTVNDGRIDVDGVTGPVTAHNVNGPVALAGLANCASVEAVNGDVDLEFVRKPGAACRVDTINGDITVRVPGGSDFDLSLDLFNGRIVSDFDVEPLALPAVVETSEDDDGREYRISQAAGLRIGRGGPMFTIASLNGDVNIRKTP